MSPSVKKTRLAFGSSKPRTGLNGKSFQNDKKKNNEYQSTFYLLNCRVRLTGRSELLLLVSSGTRINADCSVGTGSVRGRRPCTTRLLRKWLFIEPYGSFIFFGKVEHANPTCRPIGVVINLLIKYAFYLFVLLTMIHEHTNKPFRRRVVVNITFGSSAGR